MQHKILVVDDESDVNDMLVLNLRAAGFQVIAVTDGASALAKARSDLPSLIILDLMLPEMSGLEVCKVLKSEAGTRHIPVIMLTSKAEEVDKIVGLELGADDYVTKPFSPRELLARLQSAIRRTRRTAPSETVVFGNITADFGRMEVHKAGEAVVMTAHELKLLKYFVDHSERVITREKLLTDVWGYHSYPTTRTVDNQVMKLRQKLEADPSRPHFFRTMHGIGYKFVGGQ